MKTHEPLPRELDLLSRREAAALLGVTSAALSKWAGEGVGPSYMKLGSCVRYDRADLIAWAETRRVKTSG